MKKIFDWILIVAMFFVTIIDCLASQISTQILINATGIISNMNIFLLLLFLVNLVVYSLFFKRVAIDKIFEKDKILKSIFIILAILFVAIVFLRFFAPALAIKVFDIAKYFYIDTIFITLMFVLTILFSFTTAKFVKIEK